MALATGDFTNVKRRPIAPGAYLITGTYTGPASYTNGGEVITNAICHAALAGISKIERLAFNISKPTGGATARLVAFDHEPVAGTSQGKIHFYDSSANPETEVVATTNLSTFTAKFECIGA